jgi:sucrose phosphorylase
MADVIVNHISSRSPQFSDFSERGTRSRFAGLFLTLDGVFKQGASERDLLAIYRPRPGLPFTTLALKDGTRRIVWTTFTPEQIDIDVTHPRGSEYLEEILRTFGAHGIKMIRLDAIGYAIKKAGTRCSSKCIRTTSSRSRSRATWIGCTTSRCRRSCCTPSREARHAR